MKNQPGNMKNQPGTMKNHENRLGTMENRPGTINKQKRYKQTHRSFLLYIDAFCQVAIIKCIRYITKVYEI